MKFHFHHFAIGVAAVFVISSCEPQLKVTSDYDKSANFTQYKTFGVDTLHVSSSVSQINQNRIINALKDEMKKKGFTENANPDLLVHVSAILKDKQSVSASTNYYGYGGYYRPYGWGGGMGATGYTTYSVDEYKEGSLIIDLVDSKSKTLVWEGIGNKEIDKPSKDPEAAIRDAIGKILANYPPGAKK